MTSVVGYAGLTHLGLVSAAAAAGLGFDVVAFDPDAGLIGAVEAGDLPVAEPGLADALAAGEKRLAFTADAAALARCDVVTVAADVATDDDGESDLIPVEALIEGVRPHVKKGAALVVLSQVPPGFTRAHAGGGGALYCQVETLVIGQALARARAPERIIVGCAEPKAPLPAGYRAYLDAFGCPVLTMGYESAEMAKIAVNCLLAAEISAANTLAELSEAVGADWAEIEPALRSDGRIGEHAYIAPGLGIAGGNIERDLATVVRLADELGTDAGVVRAWLANSAHRKLWAARALEGRLPAGLADPVVALWGLAYKAGTDSTRNAPSLATMAALPDATFRVHDPEVEAAGLLPAGATAHPDPVAAAEGADAVLILTPWPAYAEIAAADLAMAMRGRVVIDPYRVIDADAAGAAGLHVLTLGAPPRTAGEA